MPLKRDVNNGGPGSGLQHRYDGGYLPVEVLGDLYLKHEADFVNTRAAE
jgi:hypothetical protein